jgi:hypothetical protein
LLLFFFSTLAEVPIVARKRRGGNKSEAIRTYLASHGDAAGKDVVDALAADGFKVTTQLVSNVRSRSGLTKRRRGGRRKVGRPRGAARRGRAADSTVSVATLVEAKRLVDKTGSIEAVRQALAALERLS